MTRGDEILSILEILSMSHITIKSDVLGVPERRLYCFCEHKPTLIVVITWIEDNVYISDCYKSLNEFYIERQCLVEILVPHTARILIRSGCCFMKRGIGVQNIVSDWKEYLIYCESLCFCKYALDSFYHCGICNVSIVFLSSLT